MSSIMKGDPCDNCRFGYPKQVSNVAMFDWDGHATYVVCITNVGFQYKCLFIGINVCIWILYQNTREIYA